MKLLGGGGASWSTFLPKKSQIRKCERDLTQLSSSHAGVYVPSGLGSTWIHPVLFPCPRWLQETDTAVVMQRQNPRAGKKWNYRSGNWCHRHGKLLWVSADSNTNWISENTLPNTRYLTTWQVFCEDSDLFFSRQHRVSFNCVMKVMCLRAVV